MFCVVDDFQWLDDATAQVLGSVARRVLEESVALVVAVREPSGDHRLSGLPELALRGLDDADARALLETVIPGPIGEGVRDRIVAETRGNPLALLELPRGMSAAELAGGYAKAVLANGTGRYDLARDAAQAAFEHRDHVGYGLFVGGERAEAASRTDGRALLEAALEWLSERTRVTRADWVLGIEARVRALLGEGDAAERDCRESLACLERTRLRMEFARGHLLYGEWLRREARRLDAREHLRTAHDIFAAIGADGFVERAPRAARNRRNGP